jgi:hypothetical protein
VSQFGDKQNFHSETPSQHWSLKKLTVYSVITINNLICLMVCTLKHRAQHLLAWNMHLPILGNIPIIGKFPLSIYLCYISVFRNGDFKDPKFLEFYALFAGNDFTGISQKRNEFTFNVKRSKAWRWRHYVSSELQQLRFRWHRATYQKTFVVYSFINLVPNVSVANTP